MDAKKEGRLHLRVEPKLLEQAKKLAKKKGYTLTALVEAGLRYAIDLDKEQEKLKKLSARDAPQIGDDHA